jgi:predicted nucleotidyltransferase
MRNTSSRPAGATYLNRDERVERLREAARRGSGRIPSIKRVILFGSLVSGTPTPRSDADLMIEVASSPHTEPRDRIPEMLQALSPLPCPIDLFVLTSREVEMHGRQQSPLLREILAHGIDLLDDSAKIS